MRHPAQTRADAVVDGELPALLSRLTVAVHVVVDAGTSVKRASAPLELSSVPQPLPVTVEPVGTGWPAAGGAQLTTIVLFPPCSSRWKVRLTGAAGGAVTEA
jgi:hypothetical protein